MVGRKDGWMVCRMEDGWVDVQVALCIFCQSSSGV